MQPFQRETISDFLTVSNSVPYSVPPVLWMSMSQSLQEQSVYLESCALRYCIPYFGGDEVDGGVVEVQPLN